ncbi:MAG: OsmC family protein [Saprospiraceae bacterium]|nr:OsmC family protein [Saprospiraceae bacterium]
MEDSHFYNVDIKWNHLRLGTLSSTELNDSLEVATPPPFPGGMEKIWSPEHLLVASVSSCLMTTFLAIAENSKLEFTNFECKASGKLEKIEGKFVISEIVLKPVITISNEKDREKAERIIHKSESVCLISNSIKSTIILDAQIIVNG